MRSQSGKGDDPRNVGPNFQANFPAIEWGVSNHAVRCQRTSTRRIYTYGKIQRAEIEYVPMPPPCAQKGQE